VNNNTNAPAAYHTLNAKVLRVYNFSIVHLQTESRPVGHVAI